MSACREEEVVVSSLTKFVSPFTFIPPDCVIDHILIHVSIDISSGDFPRLPAPLYSSPRYLEVPRAAATGDIISPLILFGRFVGDPLRYPWVIFRSIFGLQTRHFALPHPIVLPAKKIVILEVRLNAMTMTTRPSFFFPKMPLLKSLTIVELRLRDCPSIVKALETPESFPRLETLKFVNSDVFDYRYHSAARTNVHDVHSNRFHASNLSNLKKFWVISKTNSNAGGRLPGTVDGFLGLNVLQRLPCPEKLVDLCLYFGDSDGSEDEIRMMKQRYRTPLTLQNVKKFHIFLGPGITSPGAICGSWAFPSIKFLHVNSPNPEVFLDAARSQNLPDRLVQLTIKPGSDDENVELRWPRRAQVPVVWRKLRTIQISNVIDLEGFFSRCLFPEVRRLFWCRLREGAGKGLTEMFCPKLKAAHVWGLDGRFFQNRCPVVESIRVCNILNPGDDRSGWICPNLKILDIRRFASEHNSLISQCSNLRKLCLGEDKVEEEEEDAFVCEESFPTAFLEHLQLRSVRVPKSFFAWRFDHLQTLSLLYQVSTSLETPSCSFMYGAHFPQLETLHLVHVRGFEDDRFFGESYFPSLQSLWLQQARVSGKNWQRMPSLRDLTLAVVEMTDELFQCDLLWRQTKFPVLRSLTFCGTLHISHLWIPPLFQVLTNDTGLVDHVMRLRSQFGVNRSGSQSVEVPESAVVEMEY